MKDDSGVLADMQDGVNNAKLGSGKRWRKSPVEFDMPLSHIRVDIN